jgi:hypothetical protein
MNLLQTLRSHRILAARLRALPKQELSTIRRNEMRRKVIVAAVAMPSVKPARFPKERPGFFAAAAISAALVVFVLTSTVITAQAAKPGDALYGLDRAIDKAHLALTFNKGARANVAATIAVERQAELERITEQTPVNTTLQQQAQTNANRALDRAIEAVGKVTTHSDKNKSKIETKAAQKVQHLLEIRARIEAQRAAQEAQQEAAPVVPNITMPGNSDAVPPGLSNGVPPGQSDENPKK